MAVITLKDMLKFNECKNHTTKLFTEDHLSRNINFMLSAPFANLWPHLHCYESLSASALSFSKFHSSSWCNRPMQSKLNGEVMLSGRKSHQKWINKFSTRSSWTVWILNLHFFVQQKLKTSGHKACTTHHRMHNFNLAISCFKLCIKLTEKKCTWCTILDHLHFPHQLGWRLSWAPRHSGTVLLLIPFLMFSELWGKASQAIQKLFIQYACQYIGIFKCTLSLLLLFHSIAPNQMLHLLKD